MAFQRELLSLLQIIAIASSALVIWHGEKRPDHASAPKTFSIDKANNQFLKDGQPFQIIGVAMHYYTIAPDLWEHRLKVARAMGANAVSLYVPWNLHEPEQGQYVWDGIANVERVLKTAAKLGILVMLRPAPCIDSEWEAGGHPAWLLKYPDIKMRHSQPPIYVNALKQWYDVLLPKLAQYTYQNGGPIIMTQIENEYGGWSCEDKPYLEFIRDTLKQYFGADHILYTTDFHATYYLQCGGVEGAFAVGDFGTDNYDGVKGSFEAQQQVDGGGPFVDSEFYQGWFDSWGDSGTHGSNPQNVVETIEAIWAFNGSFVAYMGIGGTFWGFTNGAYGDAKSYSPVTTSYDFGAPVTEWGDASPTFTAVRAAVEKHLGHPLTYPVPKDPLKANYGQIELSSIGTFIDLLSTLIQPELVKTSEYPLNVEQLSLPFYYGFVLYESVAAADGNKFTLESVSDRAYFFLNGELIIVLQRPVTAPSFQIPIKKGDKIQILVENQGRICHDYLYDYKGLLSNLTIDDTTIVTQWNHYPVNFTKLIGALENPARREALTRDARSRKATGMTRKANTLFTPTFYAGVIDLPSIEDTFLNPTSWTKGQAFVNHVNLGRYWPAKGPQVTLYLPAPYLKPKTQILLFELDGPGNCDVDKKTCWIELTDHMIYK